MAAPENRLDLARITMLRRAGAQAVQQAASTFLGAEMMAKLGNDLNWMCGLLYSGPTENLGTALEYLAAIYAADDFRLKEPVTRRIATATALEFAREGWSKEDMLARFKFYNDAWHADKLNAIFDELAYWDTRLVTGCSEPGQEVGQWGDPATWSGCATTCACPWSATWAASPTSATASATWRVIPSSRPNTSHPS